MKYSYLLANLEKVFSNFKKPAIIYKIPESVAIANDYLDIQRDFGNLLPSEMTDKQSAMMICDGPLLIRDRIEVIEGDITQQRVDAIVNAANEALITGGGVSGAIHRAAGLGLEEECLKLGGCNEGEAKITQGYNLSAKWVIHTVGPVWEGGSYGEDKVLANCYRNCLSFVEPYQIKTIAFPAISTGAYSFPIEKATRIAVTEVRAFLAEDNSVEKIIFVCYEKSGYNCYIDMVQQIIIP